MTEEYDLLVDGQSQGPFSADQIRAMLRNGEIDVSMSVASAGSGQWKELKEMAALVPAQRSKYFQPRTPDVSRATAWAGVGVIVLGAVGFGFLLWATKGGVLFLVGIALAWLLYCLPFLIAVRRKHRNVVALGALNLLLGWTILGWVGALVWSLYREREPSRPN